MNNKIASRAKVTELEGLRGVLAWWVVASHLLLLPGIQGKAIPLPLRILLRGDMAVDVFIILSGFVIFMLLDKGRDTYATFITRRFFRLFPAYVVCVACMIPLGFAATSALSQLPWHDQPLAKWTIDEWQLITPNLWLHALVHLTMLHGLLPNEILQDSPVAILGPAWSISLEWQFYLVAPFLIAAVRKSQRFFFLLGLTIIGFTLAAHTFGDMFEKGKYITFAFPSFLPLKGIYFFCGACSFYAYKAAPQHLRPEGLSRLLIGLLIAIGALAQSLALLIWCAVLGTHLLRAEGFTAWPVRVITGFLNSRLVLWLGRISYSTYLCHIPVMYLVMILLTRVRTDWNQWHFFAVFSMASVPLILLASQLLYRFVEQPCIEGARAWTANWKGRPKISAESTRFSTEAT